MERASVTEVNEYLVLDAIRLAGETTRPELAAALRLSPASVSRIVRRLMAQQLVTEEPGPSEGLGRNRDLVRFNRRSGAVIAVDLGGTKCHGAVADLAGEILDEDIGRPSRAGPRRRACSSASGRCARPRRGRACRSRPCPWGSRR